MRENCSVRWEQNGCSGQGEPEQKTAGNQSPLSFRLAQERGGVFSPSELERTVRGGQYTEKQDDRYGGS